MRDGSDRAAHPAAEDSNVQQIERELQETKERLQATIEELETANEEFRSSNEELVSVNEELQSTNEELETSKEELQSTNEELQTLNCEFKNKIDELDRANSDLTNLFQSTQIATIFLDRNLVIRSFTPTVAQLVQPHRRGPGQTAERYHRPHRLPGAGERSARGLRRGRADRAIGEPRRRRRPLPRSHSSLSRQ